MRATPRRRLLVALSVFLAAGLVAPMAAQAHGIVGRADLPIPVWLFSWTAAIVLVVSFVALSTLWTKPRLQESEQHPRPLVRLPDALEWLAGAIGVGLFALVVYSGFAGAQVTQANFSVTFIYVIFWVGVPLASVLFGDIFRAFSPWRTCARVLGALGATRTLRVRVARPRVAVSALARDVARGRGDRRVRVAGARVRRTRPPVDAGGPVARLLRR